MDPFETLEKAIADQAKEGELPVFLHEALYALSRGRQRFAGREELVAQLAWQVAEYDPYAEAGCCKTACGAEDIRLTLAKRGVPP